MSGGAPPRGRRAAALLFVLAAGALLPGPASQAFELLHAETGRDGEAYWLRLEARFAAGVPALLAVLTDYERIHELHPDLLTSRSLGSVGPGIEEVRVNLASCVLFICRTLRRVEHIRVEDDAIFARDVPGRGSFSSGATAWRFTPEEAGARLRYETRFVPVPGTVPPLGSGILLSSVEQMTVELMAEVDRRALQADD